uniref:Gamma-glutamylcyclotransferase a n=1 Tax=Acanthochromis polyacanthus TaxID=80966 RepID=A0A3Q1FGW1_9TELE
MSSAAATDRFMYFAFGSNLLRERLQLANPSATFCTTGRLKDYVLNFGLWERHVDNAWHGGVATIEFCPGAEVWGVIWTVSNENLTSLDNQEGVSQGQYSPLEVSVETDEGLMLCRTYQMNNFHACPPSPQYKQVLILWMTPDTLSYKSSPRIFPFMDSMVKKSSAVPKCSLILLIKTKS